MYHTIELLDDCANLTLFGYSSTIDVHSKLVFCFQNGIINKAIVISFSKHAGLNCSEYSAVYTPRYGSWLLGELLALLEDRPCFCFLAQTDPELPVSCLSLSGSTTQVLYSCVSSS